MKWLQAGDQLIICLDASNDVKQGEVAKALQAKGLREVILDKRGVSAPSTTSDNGSMTIDGIWATQSTHVQAGGGHLACRGLTPKTNHRALWINVHYRVACGHVAPPIVWAKARRLKLLGPRLVVKWFNDKHEELTTRCKLDARVAALTSMATHPLLPWVIEEFVRSFVN